MAFSPPVAALTFDKPNKIITVDSPETAVTIQDLVNQIRDYEDELINLDITHIANAYGKQDLGGGEFVGITMELRDNWKLAFAARAGPATELMTVSGGNFIGLDSGGSVVNPISPTAFTQVVIAQSTSPSIKTPDSDTSLMYMVENLAGKHKSVGSVYYWDPVNGVDTNNGTTPSDAVLTFAQAHTLATDGNHDIIFAIASDASGITTVTERLTITKDTLKVRGPGYPFQLVPSTAGTPTVSIQASSVEFGGFYVSTTTTGTDDAISITGTNIDNTIIKDSWIASSRGDGISISGSGSTAARTVIQKCAIEDAGQSGTGNGIDINDGATRTLVSECIITGSAEDGADLTGTGLADNMFENNLIYNNSAYGIDIGSGVTRTGVRKHHTFSGNTSGDTNDNGTATFIETPAGGASASSIADAVWDEVIADHVTAGTTGRNLRDAKTKATLASLK